MRWRLRGRVACATPWHVCELDGSWRFDPESQSDRCATVTRTFRIGHLLGASVVFSETSDVRTGRRAEFRGGRAPAPGAGPDRQRSAARQNLVPDARLTRPVQLRAATRVIDTPVEHGALSSRFCKDSGAAADDRARPRIRSRFSSRIRLSGPAARKRRRSGNRAKRPSLEVGTFSKRSGSSLSAATRKTDTSCGHQPPRACRKTARSARAPERLDARRPAPSICAPRRTRASSSR